MKWATDQGLEWISADLPATGSGLAKQKAPAVLWILGREGFEGEGLGVEKVLFLPL